MSAGIDAQSIRIACDRHFADAVRIRRHLHRNPELSFREERTADFVERELASAGIPYRSGIAGHGIVATVGAPDGPVIALRADMDALPIDEENQTEYRSRTPGVMHACGHDAHMTCVLVAGRILHELAPRLGGTVRLIFQPAEERCPGGARRMIEAGVLEEPRVQYVFGQHVNPDLPVGAAGFNPGLFMASADEIYITVHGRGGHAAKPHLDVDPVVMASTLVMTLQQIVSRHADPIVPSVLSFGRFLGAGAANVIPDRVEIAGTFRTVDDRWREDALGRIQAITGALANSLGGSATVRIERGYPVLTNDPEISAFARQRACAYLGEDRVVDLPTTMWAEDFAYFAQTRPGCFYNLGVAPPDGSTHPVHTSRFDLDEEALRVGPGLMAWIAAGTLELAAG